MSAAFPYGKYRGCTIAEVARVDAAHVVCVGGRYGSYKKQRRLQALYPEFLGAVRAFCAAAAEARERVDCTLVYSRA